MNTNLPSYYIPNPFAMTDRFALFLAGSAIAFFYFKTKSIRGRAVSCYCGGSPIHKLELRRWIVPAGNWTQWTLTAATALATGIHVWTQAGSEGLLKFAFAVAWSWYVWSIAWKFDIRAQTIRILEGYITWDEAIVSEIAVFAYLVCVALLILAGLVSL